MRNSALRALGTTGIVSIICAGAWACASDTSSQLGSPDGDAGTSNGGGGSVAGGAAGGGVAGTSKAGSGGSGGMAGGSVIGASGSGGSAGSSVVGASGAGGSSGSVGSSGSGGSPPKPPSICDGAATRVLAIADAKVDDFEGAAISPGWSSFNDVMPVPNAFSIIQVAGDGAATTMKFGHFQGTGAKTLPDGGYGVGTVFNIAISIAQAKYCIDISAFDGVSFWAKAATDATVEINFVIPETNATKDGGDCLSGCYNHPRKAVTLTPAWKQYTVTFAEAGMGSAKITSRIQGLAWLAPLDSDWDYSIDEIAFYKGTPPTGPVGTAQ